ncbi:protein translocase subunit yajC [Leifsonia sp. 98AMF]|jgi:preprotein translocase subunit YajC|uniref:preprotein translocase subunit YajC n=1 Tax=Microbacteriaceae TaxID=85023 RepID=UPI0003680E2C|nr:MULTISPECIES: preprotein translocase subunit YajC [Microbacteriaceae]TDP99856.1 protein translocase subunit yajC [Leifsonia sp. 115AMFTsu3.1]SDH39965.1 protein translocase subunit yajC [Leifsonia sp. 197AMF]SDI96514.1 protein translocase subunit yajC [Leifsonia sp. 466MF]SDJ79556.1 protein translocase subunit yajC [Leifsonia sp. 157MF]SDN99807.1 protein translocase subunit yajC [Leifsonia sp. 509MF]
MVFDPLTILMVVILAALVFFMFRNSRKRRREQEETRSKMVPGAEVMTNFGLYGTLLSVNEDDNTATIETSPGHVVKVHRQVLARVVEPTNAEATSDDAEAPGVELNEDHAITHDASDSTTPEYGERLDDSPKKPGSKSDD